MADTQHTTRTDTTAKFSFNLTGAEGAQACERKPDTTVKNPPNVVIGDDCVLVIPKHSADDKSFPFDQAARVSCEDLLTSLTLAGQGYRLPQAVGRVSSLVAIKADVDPRKEAEPLPANYDQVPGAGKQLAAVVRADPEAGVLDVDVQDLEARLERTAFLQSLEDELSWVVEAIHNELSAELGKTSEIIHKGFQSGGERIPPRLLAKLPLAYNLVKKPGQKAVETRRNNELIAARAVAAERAQQAAKANLPATGAAGAGSTGGAGTAGGADPGKKS